MAIKHEPGSAQLAGLLVSAVLLFGTVTPAPALRMTCRDGLSTTLGRSAQPFCNHDEPGDEQCTFAICSRCPFTRSCVGPESGVCPDGELPPNAEVVQVPVKERRVRRIGTTRVVFHCRPTAPCDAEHRCSEAARTCEDGVLGNPGEGQCDIDETHDGVCTFGFYCLEVCGPLVATITVPAGETRVVQRANLPRIDVTQYTLRCLPAQ